MFITLTGKGGEEVVLANFGIQGIIRDDEDRFSIVLLHHDKRLNVICRETPSQVLELIDQAEELERQKFEEMEAKRKAKEVAQEVLEGQKLTHRSETERLNARFVLELERRVRVLEGNDAQDDAWYTRRINAIENRIAKLEGDKTE